jgi:hypothetical protein
LRGTRDPREALINEGITSDFIIHDESLFASNSTNDNRLIDGHEIEMGHSWKILLEHK